MPTNLYGPGDNYHQENSHVVAALIRRFHEAKTNNAPTVVVWGSGTPRREFLYVDDFADACVFLLKNYSGSQFINIGTGEDMTIADFSQLVAEIVRFHCEMTDPQTGWHAAKTCGVSRLAAWAGKCGYRYGKGSVSP
jgi:GDP-L-fucose synthase